MSSKQSNDPLEKMDVFAYLPLRSFGFSFIIQADFVVPASRQDVTQDSDWNQWIVKQIPHLFIKAFGYFCKQHIEFGNQIMALKAYMKFLPLEEEIIGFFQHVPRQIAELLRNEAFMPAIETLEDGSEIVVWKKPFECVIIQEGIDGVQIKKVLTSELLKK